MTNLKFEIFDMYIYMCIYVYMCIYNLLTQLVVRGEEVQISLREEAEEVVVD